MASGRKAVAFPAYLPDQLPRNVLTIAENVLPAADGYRAVKGQEALSNPLPATFMGGAAAISSDGTVSLIAGTSNGLERYDAGTWATLRTGLSVPARWHFAQFGDHVVGVNGGVTQDIDLAAQTASNLSDAPTGEGVAIVGDYVVVVNADGDNTLVKWSGFNDYTQWTAGVNQSGFQPMLTGGEIKGIAGGEYGVILQRFRLVRMERTGDATAPFQFPEITTNVGCAASESIVQAGRTVFFLSDRGFMALDDGSALRPIGNEKFDQSFRDTVGPSDFTRMWAAVDPKRSLVMWGLAGAPGKVWAYNWVLDRASTLSLPFSGIFAGYDNSLSLEQVSAQYPDLDTMPVPLDDARFEGGDPRLFFVDSARQLAALTGANMAARIQVGFVDLGAGSVSRIRGAWPVTDATEGVTVTIDARERLGDGEAVTVSGDMQRSGRVPVRARGRYVSLGQTIAAGVKWSYAQGIELEAAEGGVR